MRSVRRPGRTGSPLPTMALPLAFLGAVLLPPAALATELVEALGFEDDVDLIVSPNREFMVVPEESEDGVHARLRILDLDPTTGEYLGILEELDETEGVLGFENGVDGLIISQTGAGGAYLILMPVENEAGTEAKVIQLLTDTFGAIVDRADIELDDLGFLEDVDPVWDTYNVLATPGVAFFVLESEEDPATCGVLAIDCDNDDGDWGACRLVSTDGRGGCGASEVADWLPGFAPAVDPIAHSPAGGFIDLWLPVTGDDGTSDLLVLKFDSDDVLTNDPPGLTDHISVKETNAGGARPTAFPGYEREVHLVLIAPPACGGAYGVLVPVEGPGDVADLYRINALGEAVWVYSIDRGSTANILGYEAGVDLLYRCDLIPPRVLVPVENAAGTDADLFFVNLDTGLLLARAEAANPGLEIPGWEIGVDLTPWTDSFVVAPVEGVGDPGLISFRLDGTAASGIFDHRLMGFQRSVDPIVIPFAPNPILAVPFANDEGTDADIYAYFFPPNVGGGVSLESIHPALELSPFEWDVDLGVVDYLQEGTHDLCLPEERPDGSDAQLRFEPVSPSYPHPLLVVATKESGDLPATLYFVDVNTGNLALVADDLLGLETGLDMANGRGPVAGPPPAFTRPTGADRDGDPTLGWEVAATGIAAEPAPPTARLSVSHPNPFFPSNRIRVVLERPGGVELDVLDVAGRHVRRLLDSERQAGEHSVMWDGRDDRGAPLSSGIYFLEARGAGGITRSKLVMIR